MGLQVQLGHLSSMLTGGQPHLLLARALVSQSMHASLENVQYAWGWRLQLCHLSSALAGGCEAGLSLPDDQWWQIALLACYVLWNQDEACKQTWQQAQPSSRSVGWTARRALQCQCHGCCRYTKVQPYMQQNPDQNGELMDIEDLNRLGRVRGPCPFYLSREMAATANIVFMPYNLPRGPQDPRRPADAVGQRRAHL